MDIRIFSDMVNALEQVGKGIIGLKNVPAKERQRYREIIGETYSLLDSAVTLVLSRLGDLLLEEDRDVFIRKLRSLDNFGEWRQIERDVRLCSNLRATGREMNTLLDKFMRRIAVRNPEDLDHLVFWILEQGEPGLADFICDSLRRLASMAEEATQSSEGYDKAREAVSETRDVLRKERQKLISSELQFLNSI